MEDPYGSIESEDISSYLQVLSTTRRLPPPPLPRRWRSISPASISPISEISSPKKPTNFATLLRELKTSPPATRNLMHLKTGRIRVTRVALRREVKQLKFIIYQKSGGGVGSTRN